MSALEQLLADINDDEEVAHKRPSAKVAMEDEGEEEQSEEEEQSNTKVAKKPAARAGKASWKVAVSV